ncbi:hypothetical protein GOB87_03830 [Acetobacter estunensis]|uniref:Uncharacterized protein n=1 Tax=Acetobacter estunensis TaxID=104097 RepID=A0A967ECB8_9PROT|nr:hypothetical protein [Acetobacter estunensis]NHO53091.1 hypothetical protein [Acetobacter estunensis]
MPGFRVHLRRTGRRKGSIRYGVSGHMASWRFAPATMPSETLSAFGSSTLLNGFVCF